MSNDWKIDNFRRCFLDRSRWIADVIYEYKPSWFWRLLMKSQPRTWKRAVRSNVKGQWYWMPEVKLMNVYDQVGIYVVDNHEWEVSIALDREMHEAVERENFTRLHGDKTKILPNDGTEDKTELIAITTIKDEKT